MKPNLPETVCALCCALNQWMEIAESNDIRKSDYETLRDGILALAELTGQTPAQVCANENFQPSILNEQCDPMDPPEDEEDETDPRLLSSGYDANS